ncbi:MAG: ATP phosphoribosyltransferase regulatory subunit [Cyanophyceae cyanobacterium]
MIHQPPAGARDLLPLEVVQKSWINDRLQQVFAQWGYQRIVTSTLEWLDTLMAGGAIERSTVVQLQDNSEGTLGLRPELTASIARAAVTRMEAKTYPQRLCYRANVFRQPPAGHHGRQMEFYQAGVELLFAGGVVADAEVLLLLVDCLHQLGLQQWQLLLGEVGLTRSLLSPFPEPLKQEIRHCLAHLDRVALENLELTSEQQERALLLFDLRGRPEDVLQQVAQLELDETGQQIVQNLKTLVELLNSSRPEPLPLILDLSLLQTFDYYTGIVFDVVSRGDRSSRIVGQGGRYDRLLGLYHPHKQDSPGIGFSFYLEDLYTCLLASNALPTEAPMSHWLVIPDSSQADAAAFAYAQTLRAEGVVRVEMELKRRSPEQIREYARQRRIKYLAWVKGDGIPKIEAVS